MQVYPGNPVIKILPLNVSNWPRATRGGSQRAGCQDGAQSQVWSGPQMAGRLAPSQARQRPGLSLLPSWPSLVYSACAATERP